MDRDGRGRHGSRSVRRSSCGTDHVRRVGQGVARSSRQAGQLDRSGSPGPRRVHQHIGSRPLASITPMHVQAAVDERGRHCSPATLARDDAAVRAVFNVAVDADLIARSPARKVALPKVRPPERTPLTAEELLRLANAILGRYRAVASPRWRRPGTSMGRSDRPQWVAAMSTRLPGTGEGWRSGRSAADRLEDGGADCAESARCRPADSPHQSGTGHELEIVKVHDRAFGDTVRWAQLDLGVEATHRGSDGSDDHRVQYPAQRISCEDHNRTAFVQVGQPDLASPDHRRGHVS